ncbi:MAG: vitamin B12-dependent ribonucleotide reductase [Ruthenibacterium sp.]
MAVSEIGKNALQVLEKRYLAKDENGRSIEDVDGLFRRVAVAAAAADARYDERADVCATAEEFYALMTGLRFLPNSPTLMNAGRPLGQLSACFVLPVEDSMEAIFEAVKQAALIHKSGGGTGFSFSRLRQNGAPVNSTGGVASGPVSFMRVFNMATEAVKQGGTRRGANMGILRVDHPDIEEFIHCKTVNGDITNFNISVGITEAFMQAVEAGADYDLIDPRTQKAVSRISAKKLFDDIVDAAWHNGEPGIIFLDRLNRDNVVPGQGPIESTNPCGEQPLLPYESCNLGSINLVKMLRRTGETTWEIDYALLRKTVHAAVHFLDNIIDINHYPLPKIAEVTRETRKIGLGVMGFADMLLSLGVPYNSDDAVELAENMMAFINIEGHNASKELARTRGAFPLFYGSIYAREAPLRNGTVTTIAPTGTLSMIGGCSSGVEPVFGYVYIRNIMDGTEMVESNPVLKEVLQRRGLYSEELMRRIAKEGTLAHIEELPADIRAVFVCAHDITPEYHIKMQAAFQHSTDNAVSKTINLSHSATRADVANSYFLAYRLGCKGVTIYRDGSRGGQVLNIGSVKKDGESDAARTPAAELTLPTEHVIATLQPRPRPPVTMGFTERMKIGCGNLYVTVNYDENGICEVFTSTGKAGGCPSQSEATARLASVSLRSGISVDEVYNQLKGIRCPSTIRQSGMSCTSCPDAIAKVLRKVDNFIKDKAAGKRTAPAPEPKLPNRAAAQQDAPPDSQGAALTQSVPREEQPPRRADAPVVQDAAYRAVPTMSAPETSRQTAQTAPDAEQRPAQTASPFAFTSPLFTPSPAQAPQGSAIPDSLRNPYAPVSPHSAATGFGANAAGDASYSAATGFGANAFGDRHLPETSLFAPREPERIYVPDETVGASFAPVPGGVAGAGLYTGAGSSSIAVPPTSAPLQQREAASVCAAPDPVRTRLAAERLAAVPVPGSAAEIHSCPECGGPVEHEGGCVICRNCGFSKCG